jgi:hypothetical protein
MINMGWIRLTGFVLFTAAALAACGGGASVDENKPLADVQEEAQGMTADELKAAAEAYKAAIDAKQPEVDALMAKLKEIPPTQLLGDEAKALKGDIDAFGKSVAALTERLNVYLGELKSQGEDVSNLQP